MRPRKYRNELIRFVSVSLKIILFFTDPRIPDPYECRLVEVRSSEIEGGNEGLFAKRFLEVNKAIFFVVVYLCICSCDQGYYFVFVYL